MIEDWRGARVAVVGLGISNLAVARYLERRGARVTGLDRQPLERLAPARRRELGQLGIDLRLGADYLAGLEEFDAIFVTPGMPKDLPEIESARVRGRFVGSEIGLFLAECRAFVIGITGSSGKSTTTALVGDMLRAAGLQVEVGGNIGRPLVEMAPELDPATLVVLELSSFQLEMVDRSPPLAAILNISPNHLDVHRSLDAYQQAKANIVRFQKPDDWAVIGWDCPAARAAALAAGGRIARVTRVLDPGARAWLDGQDLVVAAAVGAERLASRSELPLAGLHNVDNVLAAATLATLAGGTVKAAREALLGFRPLPHRLELVAVVDGVSYINDSIATAPDRTEAALRTFDQPLVWIGGGYDKKLPLLGVAGRVASRARAAVLMGDTADVLEREIGQVGRIPVARADDMAHAVGLARGLALPGDIVLLSPACASYDMFTSFEERGERFREAVLAIEGR